MHDAYGKESLSRKEVAIAFLKGHLPQELVAMIDFDSLELTKGDFVDDFFQFHNDVTYKAKINGKQSFIYFLVELQRIPEELMAFRMLCYLVLLLKTYYRQNKHVKKLPLVLPICLYNGQVKYPFSTSIYDCFEDPSTARSLQFIEQFILLDMNTYSRAALLKHGSSSLFQTLYKESHTGDFTALLQSFSPSFLSSLDSSYLYSSAKYMFHQSAADKGAQAVKLLVDAISNQDTRRLIMSYSDQLRQEGIQQGVQQGVQQGIQQGVQTRSLEIARNMLFNLHLDLEVIQKATGLSREELSKLQASG